MRPEPEEAEARGALAFLRRLGRSLLRVPRTVGLIMALAWMALIFWVSSFEHIDGPEFMGKSGFYGNYAHAVEFGLLALWLIIAAPRTAQWAALSPGVVRKIFLVCVLYGALDEYHQMHVPGRSASLFDLLTDTVGVACTVWIAVYIGRSTATSRGVLLRFAAGIVFCALAASASTLWDEWVLTQAA